MQDLTGLNLLVPPRADVEQVAVEAAWRSQGGRVTQLVHSWHTPSLAPSAVRLYGPEVFALLTAQLLGVQLATPPEELLASLPRPFLQRDLEILPLCVLLTRPERFPLFVRSVHPGLLPARVYGSCADLGAAADGMEGELPVYASEVVRFAWEGRAFLLGNAVLDVSAYAGQLTRQDRQAVCGFLEKLAASCALPVTCVADVGLVEGRGLALVELRASWAAPLSGCSPQKVLPAIAAASWGLGGLPAPG